MTNIDALLAQADKWDEQPNTMQQTYPHEILALIRGLAAALREMERQKDGWLRSALEAKDMHREQVERLQAELTIQQDRALWAERKLEDAT